jgi:KUP system potassium uptake protein
VGLAAPAISVPLARVRAPFDLAFFGANTAKIAHGGWLPLAIGLVALHGDDHLVARAAGPARPRSSQATLPDEVFLADPEPETPTVRVRGTAVFMASSPTASRNVMLHHVKHNQVLHEQVVLLSVATEPAPWVTGNSALTVRELGQGFFRVVARCRVHAAARRAPILLSGAPSTGSSSTATTPPTTWAGSRC